MYSSQYGNKKIYIPIYIYTYSYVNTYIYIYTQIISYYIYLYRINTFAASIPHFLWIQVAVGIPLNWANWSWWEYLVPGEEREDSFVARQA